MKWTENRPFAIDPTGPFGSWQECTHYKCRKIVNPDTEQWQAVQRCSQHAMEAKRTRQWREKNIHPKKRQERRERELPV
jgi:hypothetical protein